MSLSAKEILKELKINFSNIPSINSKDWPESWKTIEYKQYRRFKAHKLDVTDMDPVSLKETLSNRTSYGVENQQSLNFNSLSNLVYYSVGENKKGKRYYPSAGARFPLEFYIVVNKAIEKLAKGVYHYNVKDNSLEFMWEHDEIFELDQKTKSTVYIIVTSILDRHERKYGKNALKFSYIETGAAVENMYLIAASMKLTLSLVSHDDFLFEKMLDIDGESEFVTGLVCLDF